MVFDHFRDVTTPTRHYKLSQYTSLVAYKLVNNAMLDATLCCYAQRLSTKWMEWHVSKIRLAVEVSWYLLHCHHRAVIVTDIRIILLD
jgi:hypothetical protein